MPERWASENWSETLEGAKNVFEELISAGMKFTFKNFASKTQYGNAAAVTPEWVAWRTRVTGAIERLFEPDSAPVQLIRMGQGVRVIGNGDDKFEVAKSYYVGGLKAAIEILEQDTFGEVVSDRTSATAPKTLSNKVFVVHGHDEKAKQELEILLREMGLAGC